MGKASHSSQLSHVETFVNRGGLKLRNELLSFYHSQVYIEQDQQALVQRTDVVNPGLQYRCDSSIKYIDNILDCNKYEFARLKPNAALHVPRGLISLPAQSSGCRQQELYSLRMASKVQDMRG
jgi:hypothetical protein